MKENYGREDSCYGVTKDPNENDYMLIFSYYELNDKLFETFGEIIWKYKIDELIDRLFDSLNEINNKEGLTIAKTTNISNELLETLKIIKNCTSCKDKIKKKIILTNFMNPPME